MELQQFVSLMTMLHCLSCCVLAPRCDVISWSRSPPFGVSCVAPFLPSLPPIPWAGALQLAPRCERRTCIPNTRQHYRRQHTKSLHDVVARVVSIRVAVRAYLDMMLVESKPLLGPRGIRDVDSRVASIRFVVMSVRLCDLLCRPESSTRPDCERKWSRRL